MVTTQLADSTEIINPQPNEQSKITNFSHPLLSIRVTIICGAELNKEGG